MCLDPVIASRLTRYRTHSSRWGVPALGHQSLSTLDRSDRSGRRGPVAAFQPSTISIVLQDRHAFRRSRSCLDPVSASQPTRYRTRPSRRGISPRTLHITRRWRPEARVLRSCSSPCAFNPGRPPALARAIREGQGIVGWVQAAGFSPIPSVQRSCPLTIRD
jgi:hypothetical protein